MSWLFVALLAPALSALGSYTDKYLIVHKDKTGGIGSIIILSCFLGAIVLPLALFFDDTVWEVTRFEQAILILNGFLTVGTLAAYLYAIKDSDVVAVVPVLQTIPVFGFALGYFVLGETLQFNQIVGSAIIILCAIALSIEIEEGTRVRFKRKSFFLAVLSSFLFAVSGIVFKLVATERGFWATQFWEFLGITILGFVLFLIIRSYRESALEVLLGGRLSVVALNFLTEAITVSADLLINYATLLAPVALVYTVNGFQPAFLLLYALIGIAIAPRLMHRLEFVRRHIAVKLIVIATMIFGVFLLYG